MNNKLSSIIIILASMLLSIHLSAASLDVKMKIVNQLGTPLQGALVSFSEDKIIYKTDENGICRFKINRGEKIEINYSDIYFRRIVVDSSEILIRLGEEDRVFAIGFNEFVTKKDNSAAIDGLLAEEDINGATVGQILSNLYGLLPGLQVYQHGSGAWPENYTPKLTVRGSGSTTNSVLFIVDGVSRDPATIEYGEVESISVLKDAASLAIYGLRGADGAVLITTKRGGPCKFRARANYLFGVENPYGIPQMASPLNYASALNEARINDGLKPYFSESNIKSIADGSNSIIPTTNWKDLMLRDFGYYNNASITLDGSSKLAKYFVFSSLKTNRGFFKNTELTEGISTQNEYSSLKIRSNLDIAVTKTTNLLINLSAKLQQDRMPSNFNGLQKMYDAPTIGLPVQFDGIWTQTSSFENPVGSILGRGNSIKFQRMLSFDIALNQNLNSLLKGLTSEVRIAYDNSADITDTKTYNYSYYEMFPVYDNADNLIDYSLEHFGNDTEIDFSSGLTWQYIQSALWFKLNYERSFNNHNVKANAIFSRDKRRLTGANNTRIYHDYILSGSYNYANKYYASLVCSVSGGSVLPKGDKFRVFPAISLSWVPSEENFLKNSSVIDFLKVRTSFGITGMDKNLDYDMDKQFNGVESSYIFNSPTIIKGAGEGPLPSIDVNPEIGYKSNIGVDLNMFKGLTAEMNIFYNKRTNIRTLAANSISDVIGIELCDRFTGEMKNFGTELNLGWKQKWNNLHYYVRGNIAFARNEITSIEEEYTPYSYMYERGNPRGRFYGLVSDGYYCHEDFHDNGKLHSDLPESTFGSVQPGDVKYKDLNGDSRIDEYDYSYQLNSEYPELYYGLKFGAEYKGFGFNALLQGVGDCTLITDLPSIYHPLYGNDKNISNHYLENYWTTENPNAKYPRLTTLENNNNYRSSDIWTVNGHYLKLRELEFYYHLPKGVIEKLKLNSATLYMRGHNLFSLNDVEIFDPEYISTGYPVARTFSVGFRLSF